MWLFVFLISTDAAAYNYFKCVINDKTATFRWYDNPVDMNLYSLGDSTEWAQATREAISLWNKNPSVFRFTDDGFYKGGSLNNGSNDIYWVSRDVIVDNRDAMAVHSTICATSQGGMTARIKEGDVLIAREASFTTSKNRSDIINHAGGGNGKRSFQSMMLHELGHVAGLAHEADEYNIMGDNGSHHGTNGSVIYPYIGEDASDAVYDLYGVSSDAFEDVSVAPWKYFGPGGEYSNHIRTDLYRADGTRISPDLSGGFDPRVYHVGWGDYIVEFTYENSGKSSQTADVRFYLSTNRTISTADTVVGTWNNVVQGRGNVYTAKRTITMPEVRGQYYLGVKIDYNNQIAESESSRNATYIGLVDIVPPLF